MIAPLGLALSREKTSIAHIDEGIEFLGWRIQRQTGRKARPQIYTYPSKPSLQAVMGKVKQITRTGQNQTLDQLLNRLNPVLRGWCDHFRHGVSSRTFGYLRAYVWRRVSTTLGDPPTTRASKPRRQQGVRQPWSRSRARAHRQFQPSLRSTTPPAGNGRRARSRRQFQANPRSATRPPQPQIRRTRAAAHPAPAEAAAAAELPAVAPARRPRLPALLVAARCSDPAIATASPRKDQMPTETVPIAQAQQCQLRCRHACEAGTAGEVIEYWRGAG